jgi:adenosylcobinamide-GDP ribazoletransferase
VSDEAAAFGDGLRLAVGTLTALPVRPPSAVDPARARVAMLLAPVVAVLPGAAIALVAAVARFCGLDALVAAALAVGTLALVTRGLHLDGLADTADGLAASYDRGRALQVMRTGDTGPAGVAAVVLVLAVQVTALAESLQRLGAGAALIAVVAGRLVLPLLCVRGVPAARSEGLGAAMAGSVPRAAAVLATVLTAAGTAGMAGVAASIGSTTGFGVAGGLGMTTGVAPLPTWTALLFGALAVLAVTLVAGLLARRAVLRLGGVTGDVLGAGVEAGTAAALVVLAAVPL